MPLFRLFLLSLVLGWASALSAENRPNLVFIIVDDLNDMPLHPEGKPYVATPHIDRLAAKGVTFTNAHCNDPICAPSRSSMNFGLYPQTTGLYFFEKWKDNGILNTSISMHEHLRNNGYRVFGSGKVYHGNERSNRMFDEYGPLGNVGPWPWDGTRKALRGFIPHPAQEHLLMGDDADVPYQWEHTFGPLTMVPDWKPDEANGVPGYKGWYMGGKPFKYNSDADRDLFTDELGAEWSREMLEKQGDEPFAMFVGFNRTHTPLYTPQEYFDRFPLDSIELPDSVVGDNDDLAPALGDRALYGFRRYKMLERHEGEDLVRKWIQAYMACVAFVDDQVGKVLDAIEASGHADDTIIIFTSDHGFHVGEKEFLYKHSLWEPSTRVPLIVAGVEGSPEGVVCSKPVSLIDMYPTINDLLGLPENPNEKGNGYELDGHSIQPFVLDPKKGEWSGPDYAITALPGKDHMQHKVHEGTYFPHFSIRGERWRYTLTSQGGEELYDRDKDPLEFENLAMNPEYAKVKKKLRAELEKLRDGDAWESFKNQGDAYGNFELEFEARVKNADSLELAYRNGGGFELSEIEEAAVKFGALTYGEWNRFRVKADGTRRQLWVNNRMVSDLRVEGESREGELKVLASGGTKVRGARVRRL
ncbi:MAG: sulfatase [Verrucomicrobiota bacterium]